MKKTMTITEARELFESEKVFATQSGFIFNNQGKYCSGLTFVLSSDFELDQDGEVLNPIRYVEDREVTDSFNLELDGEAKILFGDFWKSQKGAPCFRPKDPAQAKHILVRVDWGGCFNGSRGFYGDAVREFGATYFRRASSNGGGSGYDYWVLPVGYVYQIGTNVYRIDWETARAYCAKHSRLQANRRTEADHLYKEKMAAEAESRKNKERIAPRLEEIEAELATLRVRYCNVTKITLEESYFIIAGVKYLYAEENLTKAETTLTSNIEWVASLDAKKLAEQKAYEEFAPKFEALRFRAKDVSLEIVIDDHSKVVLKELGHFGGGSHILEGAYSHELLTKFNDKIHEREVQAEAQRQAAAKIERELEAKSMGLPSDVRVWKRTGGRTGCSKGWVIGVNGIDRERDSLYNENTRRAERYGEGFEIWNQILPGELVISWSKDCTAADHVCEVLHRPESISEAQLERVAEIQQELEEEWRGLTGLISGTESPSIGKGWIGQLIA